MSELSSVVMFRCEKFQRIGTTLGSLVLPFFLHLEMLSNDTPMFLGCANCLKGAMAKQLNFTV
jgi:hypothetical protein